MNPADPSQQYGQQGMYGTSTTALGQTTLGQTGQYDFPPQSSTPPVPSNATSTTSISYQTQRPDSHGWNDPPTTVFGAFSAKKRIPRTGLAPTAYISGAHAPLPSHGSPMPYSMDPHAQHYHSQSPQQGMNYSGSPLPAQQSPSPSPVPLTNNGSAAAAITPTPTPPPPSSFPPPSISTPSPLPTMPTPTPPPPPFAASTPPPTSAAIPPRVSSVSPMPSAASASGSPSPAPLGTMTMPADSEAIVGAIKGAVEESRANVSDNATKRILDDSERRLKSLYDKLARGALGPQVLSLLTDLSKSLESHDKPTATAHANSLMQAALSHSKEGDDSGWSVGLKRLVVEVWGKVVPGGNGN